MDCHFYASPFIRQSLAAAKFALLFLFFVFSLSGCVEKRMSLEEAKQFALHLQGNNFSPPPRKGIDILNVLNASGHYDSAVTKKYKEYYNAKSPKSSGTSKRSLYGFDKSHVSRLAEYFFNKGYAAQELGYNSEALTYLKKSEKYKKRVGKPDKVLLFRLGRAHFTSGNFKDAIEYLKEAREAGYSGAYVTLQVLYTAIGDRGNSKKNMEEGVNFNLQKIEYLERAGKNDIAERLRGNIGSLRGLYYEGLGDFEEAERNYRKNIFWWERQKKYAPSVNIIFRGRLAVSLMKQGKMVEAEHEARKMVNDSIGFAGKGSLFTGNAIVTLAKIYIEQGRLEEAEELIRAAIKLYQVSGNEERTLVLVNARSCLGEIFVGRHDFSGAMAQYDILLNNTEDLIRNKIIRDPNFTLSLLMSGRVDLAKEFIEKAYVENKNNFGPQHKNTLEFLGQRGMVAFFSEQRTQAMNDFKRSILPMSKLQLGASDNIVRKRLTVMAEFYMDFLTSKEGQEEAESHGGNAVAEAFMLADVFGGKSVRAALGASSVRATVDDPELAKLVRNEQDFSKQFEMIEDAMKNLMAAPAGQWDTSLIASLRQQLESINLARKTLLKEIERQFPKYADIIAPHAVDIKRLQENLTPKEAVFFLYTGLDTTYSWGISSKGTVAFSKQRGSKDTLQQTVKELRKALDPQGVEQYGDIPAYNLSLASGVYKKYLEPVESSWKEAEELIVICHSPLGQIPLSVLPTTEIAIQKDKNLLFDSYKNIPWLIRKVSLSRQPSAESFVGQRSLPSNSRGRKPFIGFGDPYFNVRQLAAAEGENAAQPMKFASRGVKEFHVRGVRFVENGDLDSKEKISASIEMLNRLPDTADELKSISGLLGASVEQDIFLGKDASEANVKKSNLEDKKVVVFATHALVPGDLDGLNQPALALSSPSVTGDSDDGLLMMDEIMNLRLDADWVVLSACNTGAANGAGAEAISGLGKAFFYAGTRALLVSMWPVESSSAAKLTAGIFKQQAAEQGQSRATALRNSIVNLIDQVDGNVMVSYAHPLFWAPFILVGDGR